MGQFDQLEELAREIAVKRSSSPDESYTAMLLAKGVETCVRKFSEEAIELALAAVQDKKTEATAEAADVLYHFLVLLQALGIAPVDVMTELARRQGTSGLVEKASRKHA